MLHRPCRKYIYACNAAWCCIAAHADTYLLRLQVWDNCRTFNYEGDEFWKAGTKSEAKFGKLWAAAGLPTDFSAPAELPVVPAPLAAATEPPPRIKATTQCTLVSISYPFTSHSAWWSCCGADRCRCCAGAAMWATNWCVQNVCLGLLGGVLGARRIARHPCLPNHPRGAMQVKCVSVPAAKVIPPAAMPVMPVM